MGKTARDGLGLLIGEVQRAHTECMMCRRCAGVCALGWGYSKAERCGRIISQFLSAFPTGTVDGTSTGDAFLLYARQARCKMQRKACAHSYHGCVPVSP